MSKKIKSKQIDAIPNNEELNRLISNSEITIEEVKDGIDSIYKRNVRFVPIGQTVDSVTDENEFIAAHAYGIGWVTNGNTCERIGNAALHTLLPVHNDLRACTTTFDATPITVSENGYNISYGGKQEFKKWLNPTNWYEYEDGTSAKADIEGNCDVWIHNKRFYYKSFKNITKGDVTTEGNYNMMCLSTRRYDSTWHIFKAGYTSFTKVFRADGKNAAAISGGTQRARSFSSTKEALELATGAMKATSMTVANLKEYLDQADICRAAVSSNRLNVHTAALNNGSHLMSFEEYQILFYWLPAIEFCTFAIESNSTPADSNTFFNTGDIIARDNVNVTFGYPMWYLSSYSTNLNVASTGNYSSIPAGYTNALGSRTGWIKYLAAGNTKLPVVRYRGFEIKRDIWVNVYGCYGVNNGTNTTDIYVTKNRAKWDNNVHDLDNEFRLAGSQKWNGYAREFSLNSNGDLVPVDVTSNQKGDYSYGATLAGASRCVFGGLSYYAANGGPGCLYSYDSASDAGTHVGFRTRFNDDEYSTIYN